MDDVAIQASTFKARCLAILDDVARTHSSIIITKHGKPIARLVPIDQPPSTIGSVTLVADDDEEYFSTGEGWDAGR